MKEIISIILMCVFLSACGLMPGVDAAIPDGYVSSVENFDPEGIQDHTDYCKYFYAEGSDGLFDSADEYSEANDDDIALIKGYFDDFSQWMDAQNRGDEYDFDTGCISEGDYFLIDSKEGTPIGNSKYGRYDDYSVYLFDTETDTLYYIHTNI